MQPNAMLALRLRANKRERPPGFGKIVQNGQTEPKQSLGLPEGVQRYAERRSLFIA